MAIYVHTFQSDFDVQQKYNFDIQRRQVRLKDQHWNPIT